MLPHISSDTSWLRGFTFFCESICWFHTFKDMICNISTLKYQQPTKFWCELCTPITFPNVQIQRYHKSFQGSGGFYLVDCCCNFLEDESSERRKDDEEESHLNTSFLFKSLSWQQELSLWACWSTVRAVSICILAKWLSPSLWWLIKAARKEDIHSDLWLFKFGPSLGQAAIVLLTHKFLNLLVSH